MDYICTLEFTGHCFVRLIPFSYRSNPALGDAHSLEVEMALMRHAMREKEADISLVQGKVCCVVGIMTQCLLNVAFV